MLKEWVVLLPQSPVTRADCFCERRTPRRQINPQWQTKGNVVSDFGFGPWRQRAEDFLQRFPVSYGLEQVRTVTVTSLFSLLSSALYNITRRD
jgi:hypothetical protein